MSEEENLLPANTSNEPVINIYERVLKAFINKLAPEEVYAEVVGRLKDVAFNDKVSEKRSAPHYLVRKSYDPYQTAWRYDCNYGEW